VLGHGVSRPTVVDSRRWVRGRQADRPESPEPSADIRQIVSDVADYTGGGLKGIADQVGSLVGKPSTGLIRKVRRLLDEGAGGLGVDVDELERRFEELERDELERQFEELEERARKGQLVNAVDELARSLPRKGPSRVEGRLAKDARAFRR
jgi:hypothetical protein